MTRNVMDFWNEVIWIGGGVFVLLVFALALALPQNSRIPPASGGHRPRHAQPETEEISPDGYIDSFANEIEEAGGGLPPVMRLAIPGVLLWWLGYLVVNWTPGAGGW